MKNNKLSVYILLHISLLLYSFSNICSKLASGMSFHSIWLYIFYGAMVLLLGIYAVAWQQIIKRIPLTTAFANKAVTVVWGMIWGVAFFGEALTAGKLIGAVLVIAGVILFASADGG